jgi:hypothetical protein
MKSVSFDLGVSVPTRQVMIGGPVTLLLA